MAEVEIYTTMFCPYCARAHALCCSARASPSSTSTSPRSRDGATRWSSAPAGGTTVPQIFIDGEHIGGSRRPRRRSTAPASSTPSSGSGRHERRISPPPASSSPPARDLEPNIAAVGGPGPPRPRRRRRPHHDARSERHDRAERGRCGARRPRDEADHPMLAGVARAGARDRRAGCCSARWWSIRRERRRDGKRGSPTAPS